MVDQAGKKTGDLHGLTWGQTERQGREDQGKEMGLILSWVKSRPGDSKKKKKEKRKPVV